MGLALIGVVLAIVAVIGGVMGNTALALGGGITAAGAFIGLGIQDRKK